MRASGEFPQGLYRYPGCISRNEEHAECPVSFSTFGRTGNDKQHVGGCRPRDIQLLPVDHDGRSVTPRGGRYRAGVGPGLGLSHGKGDLQAGGTQRAQQPRPLLRSTRQSDDGSPEYDIDHVNRGKRSGMSSKCLDRYDRKAHITRWNRSENSFAGTITVRSQEIKTEQAVFFKDLQRRGYAILACSNAVRIVVPD
nr:hypothetical protein [Aquisalimonas sp.]